jgi:hypothetical protein
MYFETSFAGRSTFKSYIMIIAAVIIIMILITIIIIIIITQYIVVFLKLINSVNNSGDVLLKHPIQDVAL